MIFLLDGIQVDNPANEQDITTTIKRNANLDGFLITQDADFVWIGSAYTYIEGLFYSNSCSDIEVEILDECEGGEVREIYKGVIKVSSVVINEDECSVRSKVQDNSFYSYINNNKSMEISPTQTGTKMGEVTIPPSLWTVRVFDPDTGGYSVDDRYGYRVYDLLEHAITVMTDGRVGFTSDYLWNQTEELFLTTGNALAVAGNDPVFTYTFDKLYSELNKLFNLSFFIETDTYSLPTIRIEPKDYFYTTTTGITFSDIKDLKVSLDQSKIYGTVVLGSTTLNDAEAYIAFNEDIPFFGFKQEKFYPIGQCNLDTELNLVNDYVLSSNVIQDCVMNSAPDWYDNLIFVSCRDLDEVLLSCIAKQYELNATAPPYIYNLNLNNYNKAQRHYGYLPNNLLNSFDVSQNNFHAEHAQTSRYYYGPGTSGLGTQLTYDGVAPSGYNQFSVNIFPFPYPNETSTGNYDLGGNYNNATYTYTVPVDGRYTFVAKHFVKGVLMQQIYAPNSYCDVKIRRYNAGLTLLETASTITPLPTTNSLFVCEGSGAFDCVATDVVKVTVTFVIETLAFPNSFACEFAIRPASYFECTSENVIVGSDEESYRIIQYEFTYPIAQSDFRLLVDDPTGIQTFTKWSEADQAFRTRQAWISEIKYNNWVGFATVKLISNDAIIQE